MDFHSSGTGNIRPTQQTNTIYRGPPTSAAPREGTSHVSMQPMFRQPIHQNVVVPSYPTPRQPAPQNSQYPCLQTIQPFHPSYQFNSPMQQSQTHQRGLIGINTVVGVNVGNDKSVQPSLNGPPGVSQSQMSLTPPGAVPSVPPCSNAVLGIISTVPGQQQVGVMPSLAGVGIPVSSAEITQKSQTKIRRCKYALDIINPVTRSSIFKDDLVRGQTPVVSAMSDPPSVKIRPTIQKPQIKKKIPITPPKDDIKETSQLEKSQYNKKFQIKKTDKTSVKLVNAQEQLPQASKMQQEGQQQESNQDSKIHINIVVTTATDTITAPASNTQISKDTSFTNISNQTAADIIITDKSFPTFITTTTTDNQQTDSNSNSCDLTITISIVKNSNISTSQRVEPTTITASEANEIEKTLKNMKLNEKEPTTNMSATPKTTSFFIENVQLAFKGYSDSRKNNITQLRTETEQSSNNYFNVLITPLNNNNNTGKSENYEADELFNIQVEVPKTLSVLSTHDVHSNVDEAVSGVAFNNNGAEKLSPPGAGYEAVSSYRRQQLNELSTTNTAETITVPPLLDYEEGQWSPLNPTGKKQYNLKQLMLLREAQASRFQPNCKNFSKVAQIKHEYQLAKSTKKKPAKSKNLLNNNNNNNNNNTGRSENYEVDELDNIQVELPKTLSVPSTHDVHSNVDEAVSEVACNNNEAEKFSPLGAWYEAVSSYRRQQLNELSKTNTAETITVPPLLDYEEGQWSPLNPTGKKQYNLKQLMLLREAQASRFQPNCKNFSKVARIKHDQKAKSTESRLKVQSSSPRKKFVRLICDSI